MVNAGRVRCVEFVDGFLYAGDVVRVRLAVAERRTQRFSVDLKVAMFQSDGHATRSTDGAC